MHSLLALESTSGVRELEGPEEVGGLLEVRADGGNLVHQVLNALDAVLAERVLDDLVRGDRDALAVDLGETALVDKVAHSLDRRVTARM